MINPLLEVEVAGNISRQLEPPGGGLDPAELEFPRREVSSDFPDRHLVLWLPLRRGMPYVRCRHLLMDYA